MLRTTLHPSFESDFGAAAEHAERERSVWWTFHFRGRSSGAPPPAVAGLLELHDPRFVSRLSAEIRRAVERRLTGVPWGLDPVAKAERLVARFAAHPELALPLTTHSWGYVREAAVRSVRSVNGSFALALLVHRMNDWVNDVRWAAERKLDDLRIAPDVVAGCIEQLWMFDRYQRTTARGRKLAAGLASRADVLAVLGKQVREEADDRTVRLVRMMLRGTGLDGDLKALATGHRSSGVRALAMRALLTGRYRWASGHAFAEREVSFDGDRRALALAALGDRARNVNQAGLEWVVANRASLADAAALLQPFLVHPNESVADLAQFGFGVLGIGWLPVVRGALRETGSVAIDAARTLGKHGDAADGALLFELAVRATMPARLELLGASARLGNDGAIAELTGIVLRDSDLSRAKRASVLLKKARVHVSAEDLYPVADLGDVFFARGLGRFVGALDVAAQLEVLCRLERTGVVFDLETWFNLARRKMSRAAFRPSADQVSRLNALLPQCPRVAALAKRFFAFRANAM